jgi:hypothetical protein
MRRAVYQKRNVTTGWGYIANTKSPILLMETNTQALETKYIML